MEGWPSRIANVVFEGPAVLPASEGPVPELAGRHLRQSISPKNRAVGGTNELSCEVRVERLIRDFLGTRLADLGARHPGWTLCS